MRQADTPLLSYASESKVRCRLIHGAWLTLAVVLFVLAALQVTAPAAFARKNELPVGHDTKETPEDVLSYVQSESDEKVLALMQKKSSGQPKSFDADESEQFLNLFGDESTTKEEPTADGEESVACPCNKDVYLPAPLPPCSCPKGEDCGCIKPKPCKCPPPVPKRKVTKLPVKVLIETVRRETPKPVVPNYDYSQHGDDWTCGQCQKGQAQSPVCLPKYNLVRSQSEGLRASYEEDSWWVLKKQHHGFTYYPEGSSEDNLVKYNKVEYELENFHVHAPSEHTIDGKRADLEFHFVHKSADGQVLVVSTMCYYTKQKFGDVDSRDKSDVLEKLNTVKTGCRSRLTPSDIWPTTHNFVHYTGSLTTPPCTEGVTWLVLSIPCHVCKDKYDTAEISSPYDGNWRKVQPLHGRMVRGCDGDCAEANEKELATAPHATEEETMPNGGVRYTYLPNEPEGGVSEETELNAAVGVDRSGNEAVPTPEELVKELNAEDKQESLERRAFGRFDAVEDNDLTDDAAEDELAVGGFLEKTWNEITDSVKSSLKKVSQGGAKTKPQGQQESPTKATKPEADPGWTDIDTQSGLEEAQTATKKTTKDLPEEAVGRLSGETRIQPKLYNEGVPFGEH